MSGKTTMAQGDGLRLNVWPSDVKAEEGRVLLEPDFAVLLACRLDWAQQTAEAMGLGVSAEEMRQEMDMLNECARKAREQAST